MSRKPLILFDLVSTLTDAGPRYAQAYIRMCQAWGIKPPAEDDILEALGEKNLKQIIAEFSPGLPTDNLGKFMSDCNQACDALLQDKSWEENLYPDVRMALRSLCDAGCTLGIYTGTRESALSAQLAYHDIAEFFDVAYLRAKNNERDAGKRNDELKAAQIIGMMASFGDGPKIIVGDSASDLVAAEAAGAVFIGFATTPLRAQKMRDAGAVHLFSDYAKLPALITQIVATAPDARQRPSSSLGGGPAQF
jgi:phosphoglycolate phosphatase-like HAD superfamily hydrolase